MASPEIPHHFSTFRSWSAEKVEKLHSAYDFDDGRHSVFALGHELVVMVTCWVDLEWFVARVKSLGLFGVVKIRD